MTGKHRCDRNVAATLSNTTSTIVQTSRWASLNDDMIRLIAQRVLSGDFVDYTAFRAVCKHWRSNTTCPKGRSITDPSFHPQNWMMFPEGRGLYPGHRKLQGYIRFINLATGAFARLFLPMFRDHCAVDSVNGLLLLQCRCDTTMRLLHPFTGDMVNLPQLITLAQPLDMGFPESMSYNLRCICASVSVDATGAVTVMLALPRFSSMVLAVATSSGHEWTLFHWDDTNFRSTPLSFQGKLYKMIQHITNRDVKIFRIEQSKERSPTTLKLDECCHFENIFLPECMAECDGEILVLCYNDLSFSRFSIYKLADLRLGRFVPVTSIGDYSIFIGDRSICVSTKASPTIAGNTIFFLHPIQGRLAKYCLSSDTTTMDEGELVQNTVGPHTFIHHIFTCCYRAFWNKGQLICPVSDPWW